MSSTAERTLLKEPVGLVEQGAARPVAQDGNLDQVATSPPGSVPTFRRGFVPVNGFPTAEAQLVPPGGDQRTGASPVAREARPARADTRAAQPRLRGDGDTGTGRPAGEPGGVAIGTVHLWQRDSGTPPGGGPPRERGREGAADNPDDPLGAARRQMKEYLNTADPKTAFMRARGLEERLLELEVIAREQQAMRFGIDLRRSREYKDVKSKYDALQKANPLQAQQDGTGEAYRDTYEAGDRTFLGYYQGLPILDHGPTEGNPTQDEAAFFQRQGAWVTELRARHFDKAAFLAEHDEHGPRILSEWSGLYDRQIAAARAARLDLQRQMDIRQEAAQAWNLPTEVTGRRADREEDRSVIGREAEALVRAHADSAQAALGVLLVENLDWDGFERNRDSGLLQFGPVEVTHSDDVDHPVTYKSVTLGFAVTHPYGQIPREFEVPAPDADSELQVTTIQIMTQDDKTIEFSLHKTTTDGNVTYAILPVIEGEDHTSFDAGVGARIFSEFPGSDRKKLDEVLRAVAQRGEPKEVDPFERSFATLLHVVAEQNLDRQTLEHMQTGSMLEESTQAIEKYKAMTPGSHQTDGIRYATDDFHEAFMRIPPMDDHEGMASYDRAQKIRLGLFNVYLADAKKSLGVELPDDLRGWTDIDKRNYRDAAIKASQMMTNHLRSIIGIT